MNMQIVSLLPLLRGDRPSLRCFRRRWLAAGTALLLIAGSPCAHAELSAASGATEVTGGTGTRQITSPGTYFLSGDLVTGGADGIQILASNVTLDLNGHAISTAAPGTAYNPAVYDGGIYSPNTTNVTVRNGHINGFLYGVYMAGGSPNSSGHLLEDLSLDGNTTEGIYLTGGQGMVRRCAITHTGGSSQNVGVGSCGVLCAGPGNRVLDCEVAQVSGNPSDGTTYAIYAGAAAQDTFAWKNRVSGATYGICYDPNATGKYARNLAGGGVSVGFFGGTDAGGNYADGDGNGIDDAWELRYFGHTGVDPNADPDGDGLTNLQEYQQGSDPHDFYNGSPPKLTVVSGTPQTGSSGGFAPQPLVVQLADANGIPFSGVAVTFSASGGQLQASNRGTPGASLTVPTDGNGQAEAFFSLPPGAPNTTYTVTAQAGSHGQSTAAFFTIRSDDGSGSYGSPFTPTDFVSQGNPDGSVDLSWTNHTDDQTPVKVEFQQADGTWRRVATLAPGTRSYHYTPGP